MVDVSIVVISYNTRKLLRECLRSIEGTLQQIDGEAIVVDNASADGSPDMVAAEFPSCRLIANTDNVGFACACNQGITEATGRFLLLLNSDAFISAQALQVLIDFMNRIPRAGICGPQLLFEDGKWQRSFGRIESPLHAFLAATGVVSLVRLFDMIRWQMKGPRRPRQVEYVDGACMYIRRAAFEDIGPLDDRFFFFVEDMDYCLRARRKGWQVYYVPASQVVHLRGQSASSKDLIYSERLKRRSLRTFITEHYGPKSWKRYLRWSRWNFRVRHFCCRIVSSCKLVSAERCDRYRAAAAVYSEPDQI
jgi:GT2 family glycosyltransferase